MISTDSVERKMRATEFGVYTFFFRESMNFFQFFFHSRNEKTVYFHLPSFALVCWLSSSSIPVCNSINSTKFYRVLYWNLFKLLLFRCVYEQNEKKNNKNNNNAAQYRTTFNELLSIVSFASYFTLISYEQNNSCYFSLDISLSSSISFTGPL